MIAKIRVRTAIDSSRSASTSGSTASTTASTARPRRIASGGVAQPRVVGGDLAAVAVPGALSWRSRRRSEQALGPEEEDEDEDREHQDQRAGAGQVQRTDGLDEPDHEPADHGAGDAAQTAEHDDDEREDRELLPDRRASGSGTATAARRPRPTQAAPMPNVIAYTRLTLTPTSAAPWVLAETARIDRPKDVFRSTTVSGTATTAAPPKAISRS